MNTLEKPEQLHNFDVQVGEFHTTVRAPHSARAVESYARMGTVKIGDIITVTGDNHEATYEVVGLQLKRIS